MKMLVTATMLLVCLGTFSQEQPVKQTTSASTNAPAKEAIPSVNKDAKQLSSPLISKEQRDAKPRPTTVTKSKN